MAEKKKSQSPSPRLILSCWPCRCSRASMQTTTRGHRASLNPSPLSTPSIILSTKIAHQIWNTVDCIRYRMEAREAQPARGGFWDLAIGEYIAFNHISHIESSRHSFNFLPTTPAQRNPSHSQLTDDGAGDFGETPGSSVLGRRKRTESLADWSPPTKARLTLYAGEVAGEYEVPESSHEEFINASIVSSCYPCRRTERGTYTILTAADS